MFEEIRSHYQSIANQRIIQTLDEERVRDFSLSVGALYFDYSKTSIDRKARKMLLDLAAQRDVFAKRDAMFAGEKINTTENRAVLHTALRQPKKAVIHVDGQNVIPQIHSVLDRMRIFSEEIRSGAITSSTGEAFTDIVNIGIGGSDLGPVMANAALAPYHTGPRAHFIANVDGADIHDTLKTLNPQTTLILIASKTFTTIETMTNAQSALHWLSSTPNPAAHLAAISSAQDKAAEMGITPERVFGFEDWVGGRYSLWGPIGLSLMLAIGADLFDEFLAGGREMDVHFQNAKDAENLPLILALIGIWHRNICHYPTRAILPYEERLKRLPAYLQQLDMESNGKSVDLEGNPVPQTGPVVWGEPGTNGQHAFYQLIHQGTDIIPCEFMVAQFGHEDKLNHQHQLLIANCLAQAQALLQGRSYEQALEIAKSKGFKGEEAERQAKHRVFAGNKPSTMLIYPRLTPRILGQIIALYEHRVFVEGAIWGINSFDQWGVELGKELALSLQPALEGQEVKGLDASTKSLINKMRLSCGN